MCQILQIMLIQYRCFTCSKKKKKIIHLDERQLRSYWILARDILSELVPNVIEIGVFAEKKKYYANLNAKIAYRVRLNNVTIINSA